MLIIKISKILLAEQITKQETSLPSEKLIHPADSFHSEVIRGYNKPQDVALNHKNHVKWKCCPNS